MSRTLDCRCVAYDCDGNVAASAPLTLDLRAGEWRGHVRLEFDAYTHAKSYLLTYADTGGVFVKKEAPEFFDALWPGDAVEIDWHVEQALVTRCPA